MKPLRQLPRDAQRAALALVHGDVYSRLTDDDGRDVGEMGMAMDVVMPRPPSSPCGDGDEAATAFGRVQVTRPARSRRMGSATGEWTAHLMARARRRRRLSFRHGTFRQGPRRAHVRYVAASARYAHWAYSDAAAAQLTGSSTACASHQAATSIRARELCRNDSGGLRATAGRGPLPGARRESS